MAISGSSHGSHSRQLIQPTSHIPWSVDVIRLVPKQLKDLTRQTVASCSLEDWGALTTGDGYVHLWYEPSKGLSERMMESSSASSTHHHHYDPIKMFFPDLIAKDDIHLVLCPTSSSGAGGSGGAGNSSTDSIHLFVWHAGWLFLKKATIKDFVSSASSSGKSKSTTTITRSFRPHNAKIKVDFQHEEEVVTSLIPTTMMATAMTTTTAPTMGGGGGGSLILSTSLGNLYWVTVTSAPVGLHVQKIKAETGFLSRLVFGNGEMSSSTEISSLNNNSPTTTDGHPHPGPSHILPLSTTQFLSISERNDGQLLHWKTKITTGTAHYAKFELLSKTFLNLRSFLGTGGGGGETHVVKVTLSSDQESIYAIVSGWEDGIEKLYWIQTDLDGSIIRREWINRFAEPSQVDVLGLIVTENENVYATFYQRNIGGGIFVMTLCPDEDCIQEVELPIQSVPSLLPNMMECDTRTHGCTLMTSTGLGLRVRYIPREIPPSAKKARHGEVSQSGGGGGVTPVVNTALVSHIRSSFWQAYQDPETHRPLPPSLPSATPEVLAQAIIAFAMELQHKGDASSAQNPMEWHRAYIKFLQERGLYRKVGTDGRWQLLSIGQELAAFDFILHYHHHGSMIDDDFKSYGIADWLLTKQEKRNPTWAELLCGILNAAMQYRDDHASYLYDVVIMNKPTSRMWLSHPSLQRVIKGQFDGTIEVQSVETFAKAALLSFSEDYPSKQEYQYIQQTTFALLRSFGQDEVAFELAVQYRFFEGLCELAIDHEKQHDAAVYSLEPLFATIQEKDVITSYTFAQYVLQWHTDNGYFGHVINYGRHAPSDLEILMETDDRLRKYRWIPAIRQSFMDQATESCLANIQSGTLKDVQWMLSMAKLTNILCVTRKNDRGKLIEGKLDLVNVQESLDGNLDGPPKSPENLIGLALEKLTTRRRTPSGTGGSDREDMDEYVRAAMNALAVCNAIQDGKASLDYTAQVWAETLRLDEEKWNHWLKTDIELTSKSVKDNILNGTIFGLLLQECRQEQSTTTMMSNVIYGRHIESAVLEKMGIGKMKLMMTTVKFSRILRFITADPDSYHGQSLIAARF